MNDPQQDRMDSTTDAPPAPTGDEAGADHHGQDGGREKVWAGSSQDEMADEQEQRLPSMSQNNASQAEKVAGIVAQVRADAATGSADEVRHVLAQRLEQAGLTLGDDEIDEHTRQITAGA